MNSEKLKANSIKNKKTQRIDEIFRRLCEAWKVLNETKKPEPIKKPKYLMKVNGVKYGKNKWDENWKEVKK